MEWCKQPLDLAVFHCWSKAAAAAIYLTWILAAGLEGLAEAKAGVWMPRGTNGVPIMLPLDGYGLFCTLRTSLSGRSQSRFRGGKALLWTRRFCQIWMLAGECKNRFACQSRRSTTTRPSSSSSFALTARRFRLGHPLSALPRTSRRFTTWPTRRVRSSSGTPSATRALASIPISPPWKKSPSLPPAV
jgi:hypothetical protein